MTAPAAPPLRIAYNRMNPENKVINTLQEDIHRDLTTFLIFGEGGVGSGKSHAGVMKAIQLSKLNAGVDGGFLVPDYAMFKRDILSIFQKIARKAGFEVGYNGHGHYFEFPWAKGAKLWVFSADTEFPGANLGWGIVNEYSIIPLEKIEEFVERRVRLACPYPQILLVGTPEDKFGWLDEYTDKWMKELNEKGKAIRFIHGSSDLNAHNLRPGYVDLMRRTLSPADFDLWFKGLRVHQRPDSFYYSFTKANLRKCEREPGQLVHAALDFNVGNMHAILAHIFGSGDSKRGEVFHEIVLGNVAADTFAMGQALKDWNGGHTRDILITCDASGRARKTTGPADALALESMGFKVRCRDANPLMRDRQLRANGLFAHKRLAIDPSCKILIRDLERVQQDKVTLAKFKDKKGIFTHSSDGLDYLLDFEFPDIDLRGQSKFRQGKTYAET